jgi:pimeloyl-ACP methyl ester carboxylesterase
MKPSIFFSHGIWADGSSFQKLIPALREEGHQVIAAQYGLDAVKGDVDATIRSFGRVSGPIFHVGHSYGGTVITHAGTDKRVAALVYMSSSPPISRRPLICSRRTTMEASHGGQSLVGPSWPATIAPFIPP